MRKYLSTLTLLGAILVQLPSDLQAKDFQFEYQRILQTGPKAELSLNFLSGDLKITSGDDDRLIIEAIKLVNAADQDEAQLVADHIEIKIKHDKNKVEVRTNYLRIHNRARSFWSKILGTGGEDSFGEVNWNIQVPARCHISIVNRSGRIEIGHVIGDVEIRSSAAEIELISIEGAVSVRSSVAEIELTSIEGAISIENSSGSTTGELLFGPVEVRQAQGRIDLKFVEGDIRVKSSSADITISQDRGALDLSTSSGNVDIQTSLDSSRDYFVRTESGHIILSIPETSSADLRIESKTGDIKTEIPIAIKSMSRKQVEGTFGFGGVKINLTSISGDVTVAQF